MLKRSSSERKDILKYRDAFDRKIDASFPIPEDQWGSDEDDKEQYETHEGVDEENLCTVYVDALIDNPDGMFMAEIDEATYCTNDGLREWIGYVKDTSPQADEDEHYTVSSCNYHKNKINAEYKVEKWVRED